MATSPERENPFRLYERDLKSYKALSNYLAVVTALLALFELLFVLRYTREIFKFKSPQLIDTIVGSMALVAPLILLGFSLLLWRLMRTYGEFRSLKELFMRLRALRLRRAKEVEDGEYAMISGEVIAASYESPIIGKWILFSYGEIYKQRPKGKGVEDVILRKYSLPTSIFKEGLRCRDDQGTDFIVRLPKGDELKELMEEMEANGSSVKLQLDTVKDKELVERIAVTPFRDVLTVKVSAFEMYDTVGVREWYVPSDRRRIMVIGDLHREDNRITVSVKPNESFLRFSSGGLSPVKTLEQFLRPVKAKMRRVGDRLKRELTFSILMLGLAIVTQTAYVIFLRRLAL